MDPVLPTFSNELRTFPSDHERSSKRPRQLNTPSPAPLPVHTIPSYPIQRHTNPTHISPNRVTISSLLSMRPSTCQGDTPLPTLNQVLSQRDANISHSSEPIHSSTPTTESYVGTCSTLPSSMPSTTTPSQVTNYSRQLHHQHSLPVQSRASSTKRKVIPCPYDFCQKKFSRNSNLKVHMRIHTKTYPFACNLCEREFMWSSSLHWHTKWHEKVAQREADKVRGANGMAQVYGKEVCTCNCVCPVHKTTKIALANAQTKQVKQIATTPYAHTNE